jgi:hypothetical protein
MAEGQFSMILHRATARAGMEKDFNLGCAPASASTRQQNFFRHSHAMNGQLNSIDASKV